METLTWPVQSLAKILTTLFLLLAVSSGVYGQARVVELQVFADPRAQAGSQQRWMQMLSELGADRVSSVSRKLNEPSIEEDQYGGSTIVTVTGILKNDRLIVPGNSFSRTDKAKIRKFLQQLRDDGKRVALADKKAFGLTSEQLVELHGKLTAKVEASTADQTVSDVASDLMSAIPMKFAMTNAIRSKLAGSAKIENELSGLSAGTALATVLRPLNLALVPRREQGRAVELHIVPASETQEFWPAGWPPEAPPIEAEPRLFERRAIRIERFALSGALDAVQKLCGVPFVYDHQSINAKQIDLATTEVTFVRKRASYMVTLGKLLSQPKPRLDYELRLDENGTPFLWIFAP